MKLNNYSIMSRMIWDAWSDGKITVEEKDEMIEHLLKPGYLEERVWWFRISNTFLIMISLGLLLSLVICWAS